MSGEFVEKFGYRPYTGNKTTRVSRITGLALFEMTSTWRKSTFGKVLLVIILIVNFISIMAVSTSSFGLYQFVTEDQKIVDIHKQLSTLASYYMGISSESFRPIGTIIPFLIMLNIGFLLVPLLGIAGSGMFADDKQGHLVEIYLSKLRRTEYVAGKIGAVLLYNSIIITLPLFLISVLLVQSNGMDHLKFLDSYAYVIIYGMILSLLIGLVILVLSIIVEKRSYASLSFFLLYFLGTIFGELIYQLNPNNEFLLLIPNGNFLTLLGYTIFGQWQLESVVLSSNGIGSRFLDLNDGIGLEYYHVLGVFVFLVCFLSLFLYFRLRRLTTKEL